MDTSGHFFGYILKNNLKILIKKADSKNYQQKEKDGNCTLASVFVILYGV